MKHTSGNNGEVDEDMDTIFETFHLERPQLQTQAHSSLRTETSEGVPTVQQAMKLRRSTRTRRPMRALHIDPARKRYPFCPYDRCNYFFKILLLTDCKTDP